MKDVLQTIHQVLERVNQISNDIHQLKADMAFHKNFYNDMLTRMRQLEKKYESVKKELSDLKKEMRDREDFFMQQVIEQNHRLSKMQDQIDEHTGRKEN